jgi:hypothetical protein
VLKYRVPHGSQCVMGRERVLFIGTEFSILYTSVYRGCVLVCLVFVVACKYALRRS